MFQPSGIQEVVRLFHEKFPNLPPIFQRTISKIEKKFFLLIDQRDAHNSLLPHVDY